MVSDRARTENEIFITAYTPSHIIAFSERGTSADTRATEKMGFSFSIKRLIGETHSENRFHLDILSNIIYTYMHAHYAQCARYRYL